MRHGTPSSSFSGKFGTPPTEPARSGVVHIDEGLDKVTRLREYEVVIHGHAIIRFSTMVRKKGDGTRSILSCVND